MTAPYYIDAKAAELDRDLGCCWTRTTGFYQVTTKSQDMIAAALREARETALREVQSKIDAQVSARKKYGARGADLTDLAFCKGIVAALLAPAETETTGAS